MKHRRKLFQNCYILRRNKVAITSLIDVPDLLKKVITGNESWVYGYDIETIHPNWNVPKIQDRKKHAKSGQMWRFCSLSIAMAWYIMKSCHKVVRSVRNNFDVMRRLREAIRQKRTAHTLVFVREFWPKTKP